MTTPPHLAGETGTGAWESGNRGNCDRGSCDRDQASRRPGGNPGMEVRLSRNGGDYPGMEMRPSTAGNAMSVR